MALRRTFRVALTVLPIVALAACVAQQGRPVSTDKAASSTSLKTSSSQSRQATYSCADGGMITIVNLGSMVRVVGPDGDDEEFPASPVNQTSRYEQGHDAIVLDGRDALIMKRGQVPLTCTH